eukprot:2878146-Amphidinium_carterae.1
MACLDSIPCDGISCCSGGCLGLTATIYTLSRLLVKWTQSQLEGLSATRVKGFCIHASQYH